LTIGLLICQVLVAGWVCTFNRDGSTSWAIQILGLQEIGTKIRKVKSGGSFSGSIVHPVSYKLKWLFEYQKTDYGIEV
jgi:hypothetical protein